MYDWISQLQAGQRVLDIGSGPRSFGGATFPCTVVSLDEDVDAFVYGGDLPPGHSRIFGRSHSLPFADASFELVVCNHVLEHVEDVDATLGEVARVLKPGGRLFVIVPNGYGLCDGVYRYVFEGGGHINRFHRRELADRVEAATGLHLVRWSKLYSSFVYLWRLVVMQDDVPPGLSPRLARLLRLPRRCITAAQHLLYSATRLADRKFGTDFAIYGWAFYFERSTSPALQEPGYVNVCRYCGTGHPAAGLDRPAPGKFRCQSCNGLTPFFPPFRNTV
jgi:SAM-dependent methyltransferase